MTISIVKLRVVRCRVDISRRLFYGVISTCLFPIVTIGCNDSSTTASTSSTSVISDATAPAPQHVFPDEETSKKLLAASRKEASHPGIILRFSCQIPVKSSYFHAAELEQQRAEHIFDTQIGKELRLEAAKDLQDTFYSSGRKITVSVRESPYPKFILHYVLFDRTTAYVYAKEGTDKAFGRKLLPLGVREVVYDGPDEESSNEWKAEDVHRAEFGPIENKCEAVRDGTESPDSINATVANPK